MERDWFGLQRGWVAAGLLAGLPGCSGSDKDKATDSSTDPGTTGDTGGTSTSGGTTGETSGDTPTDGGTGDTAGDATTGDATTGDATTGDPTTGGEEPPVCVSYGAKYAECLMEPTAARAYEYACTFAVMQYYKYYGADCVQAYEAYLVCFSALSCAEFLGDLPVCEAEDAVVAAECD